MAVDPVDGQAVDVDDVAENDDRFGFTFVDGRLVDSAVGDVAPEEHAALEVEIERRRAVRLVDDGRQIATVERKAPDVRPMSEKQGRVTFVGFAARPIVRIARVSRQTLAFERAFLVDTSLGARTRFETLVHILK